MTELNEKHLIYNKSILVNTFKTINFLNKLNLGYYNEKQEKINNINNLIIKVEEKIDNLFIEYYSKNIKEIELYKNFITSFFCEYILNNTIKDKYTDKVNNGYYCGDEDYISDPDELEYFIQNYYNKVNIEEKIKYHKRTPFFILENININDIIDNLKNILSENYKNNTSGVFNKDINLIKNINNLELSEYFIYKIENIDVDNLKTTKEKNNKYLIIDNFIKEIFYIVRRCVLDFNKTF